MKISNVFILAAAGIAMATTTALAAGAGYDVNVQTPAINTNPNTTPTTAQNLFLTQFGAGTKKSRWDDWHNNGARIPT